MLAVEPADGLDGAALLDAAGYRAATGTGE
jgi:hypothetical protein